MRWDAETDVAVVGAGMTATAACRALEGSRTTKVSVIEKAAWWNPNSEWLPTERDMRSGRGLSPDDLDPIIGLSSGDEHVDVAKWWQPRLAGGGSVLWYGQVSRFEASDFESYGDRDEWPIDLDDLEDGYRAAEAMLHPYGSSYGVGDEQYSECDTSTWRARPPAHFEREVIDRLGQMGLRPYIGKCALGGRAWDQAPIDPVSGTPTGKPPLASRRNPFAALVELLSVDDRFELMSRSSVRRLIINDGKVSGLEVCQMDESGAKKVLNLKARFVLLASGPLESCRLLLASNFKRSPGIGAGITTTLERVAYCVSQIERSQDAFDRAAGTFGGVVIKDYYAGHQTFGGRKAGKFALYDAVAAELPSSYARNSGLDGVALTRHLADAEQHYVFKVSFKGESEPSAEKRVSLGRRLDAFGAPVPQIHYAPHPHDEHLHRHLPAAFAEIFANLEPGEVNVRPAPTGRAAISAHHHGGVTMGAHKAAPADADGVLKEADNVLVVDASTFPTSGGTNTSMTAMANAHRVTMGLLPRL